MELKTVKDVIDYVKPIIDDYRKFPSHEEQSINKLKCVFSEESNVWQIVIDDSKFLVTFNKGLGKNRRKFLKRLLLIIDQEKYKSIDFDLE